MITRMLTYLDRWWRCYKGVLFTYKDYEDIITRGTANLRNRLFDVADFRGYECPRCKKYHYHRVFFTGKDNDYFILEK